MKVNSEAEPSRHSAVFLTTRWSRVWKLHGGEEQAAQQALAGLCRDYWKPLYHFARRRGSPPEDAQDLTQGFILHLLEKDALSKADRGRGRFRTFLMTAFSHFMMNEYRRSTTLKRGGPEMILSLDDPELEAGYAEQAGKGLTPEEQYDRTWALALLEKVMQRLKKVYAMAGREALFEGIQPFLSGRAEGPGYAKIGGGLGMSEGALTVAVHRMRKRYGQLLREEIADTVGTTQEMEEELRHLMAIVAQAG